MSAWDLYTSRMNARGATQRTESLKREKYYLSMKLKNSLSYHKVAIDGTPQDVAIINTDNLNEKYIYSLPDENIKHGGVVDYEGFKWLITEKDAANEVYTKCFMEQCNHLLKWIDSDGVIHQQWCIVKDGTKYLTGEYGDRNYVITRGDMRLTVTVALTEATTKLGRTTRFLIDNPGSPVVLAYALSKPLKYGGTYDAREGVYTFVLQEVNTTKEDNIELGIADYYKYHEGTDDTYQDASLVIDTENTTENGREVWL